MKEEGKQVDIEQKRLIWCFRIHWKEDLRLHKKLNSQGNSVKRTIPTTLFHKMSGHSFSYAPVKLCLFSYSQAVITKTMYC